MASAVIDGTGHPPTAPCPFEPEPGASRADVNVEVDVPSSRPRARGVRKPVSGVDLPAKGTSASAAFGACEDADVTLVRGVEMELSA